MAAPLRSMLQHSARWTRPRWAQTTKRFNHTHHGRREARAFPPVLVAVALLGTATYYAVAPARQQSLNGDTFTPYTITCRQLISPTSVIFTIRPHQHDPSLPYLLPGSAQWKHPLWSVEFKQPEVQIARHYTPLPPVEGADTQDGTLSFYVRAVGGGEMSNYLNRLGVGQDVYLRGPHAGFDVLGRLGGQKKVVFLAGGTGIVPGMQVARAVLESDPATQVKLLWAVRKREEVQRGHGPASRSWWHGAAPTEVTAELEQPSAMGRLLVHMKSKYGGRLDVRVAVDEERSRFTESHLRDALSAAVHGLPDAGAGCQLHDQLLHGVASEFEEPGVACRCSGKPGKNLFMVSGPDGFIAHYAGDKIWLGGTLTQGSVGGVAGALQKKNSALANDWLVLKL